MRCKPGDLAIITSAELKENIGLIVEILNRLGVPPDSETNPCWWVRTTHPVTSNLGRLTQEGWVPDYRLRPNQRCPYH